MLSVAIHTDILFQTESAKIMSQKIAFCERDISDSQSKIIKKKTPTLSIYIFTIKLLK